MNDQEQTHLPIPMEQGTPSTLDHLHRKIDAATKDALEAIRAIIKHDDMGWIWDEVTSPEFLSDPDAVGNYSQCLLDESRKAKSFQDGYDTWPARKVNRHFILLREASAKLAILAQAFNNLRAAELAEFSRLGGTPTISKL